MELSIEELITFCKKKGFVYPSSEIYGGLAGLWDYGHLGTLLKKNFENLWRNYFLRLDDNFYELECSEIMPEKVFVASGHLQNFVDVACKCKKGHIEKAENLLEKTLGKRFDGLGSNEITELIKKNKIVCQVCKSQIDFVGPINMMFPIELGISNSTKAYLRPETAQSAYVNFKLQYEINRGKLPMGLALIGKAYRNELSPRNMLLRQRAFFQAELQIFFNPSKINEHRDFETIKSYKLQVVESGKREKGVQYVSCGDLAKRIPKFYVYYMAKVQEFYLNFLQFPKNKFRFYELNEQEKAFYNKYHFDVEIDLGSLGWVEVGGVHYRTDHDLKGHQEISKENMMVFDEESKERFVPHVLELSFGVDRNVQAILFLAYSYDKKRENVVLQIDPRLASIKAAVFPIVKEEGMVKFSREIYNLLREEMMVKYDESGSIGRRYSRNDEIGTPYCVTIDENSLKDDVITIRDRDSTEQIKVPAKKIKEIIKNLVERKISFKEAGELINTRKK